MIPEGFTEGSLVEGFPQISAEYVKEVWRRLSSETRVEVENWGVDIWWKRGFPLPKKDPQKARKDFSALAGLISHTLLKPGNAVARNYSGSGTCNMYHPERFEAESFAKRVKESSVLAAFKNRIYMRKCVRRCLAEIGKLDESSIRYALRTSGIQLPGNFRPSAAKWVYKHFCPRGGNILDPSSGWGGRALAAFSLPGLDYLGVDPHERANEGNREMLRALEDLGDSTCRFEAACAEDFMPTLPKESFDCIFTSPPYFNVEKYDDSEDQSHRRYPEYPKWRDQFLGVIVSEAYRLLKPDGWFLMNVSEMVRHKFPLAQDVRDLAAKCGFYLRMTYKYVLNPRANFAEKHRHRGEPILLFCKDKEDSREIPERPVEVESEDFRIF